MHGREGYVPPEASISKTKSEARVPLAELLARGDFYRTELDAYLEKHRLTTADAVALARHRHWSELVFDLEIPNHSLPKDVVEALCKHNGATPKLFNFLREKVQGFSTFHDVFKEALNSSEGRYLILQDLHRADGVFTFSTDMFKQLIAGFGTERAAQLSSSICWYTEEGLERGRFTDLVIDESLLNFLLDHGVILNIWLSAQASILSWSSFERVLKSVTDESHGRDRDLAEWTLVRALGERQWVNNQRFIEPLEIPDNRLRSDDASLASNPEAGSSSWLDLALKHRVLPLLLQGDRLSKVSGFEKRHVDALVEQTVDNLSYNAAQEKIDTLIAACRTLPGFALTPEYVKRFLDLNWDPKDTYAINDDFVGALLEKHISVDFSVMRRVREISWRNFIAVLGQQSRAIGDEFRQQLLERLFGETTSSNGGGELEPLHVVGAQFDGELVDALIQAGMSRLLVDRNWLPRVSGIEMHHLEVLVEKICSNSDAQQAQERIAILVKQRAAVPAFKITPKFLKDFLSVGWQPQALETVDCLVETYGAQTLAASEDIIRPLLAAQQVPEFSVRDLEKISGEFGRQRKLFTERSAEPVPERAWHITASELQAIAKAGQLDRIDLSSNDKAAATVTALIEVASEDSSSNQLEYWRDPTLVASFVRMGETFGFDKAFSYYGYRPDTNRHDAYHEVDQILEVFKNSGLGTRPEQFYHAVLQQVGRDGATYGEDTSYRYLNTIVREFGPHADVAGTLSAIQAIAQARSSLPELRELEDLYTKPQDIFSSWARLRLFYERLRFVGQAELLDTLEHMKQAGEDKKYRFALRLLTHKDSRVSVQALKTLFENPREFFATPDKHTPQEIQDSKKPSNYFSIPHLDLTPEELRDAYLRGDLARLQALPPFAVEYRLNLRAVTKTQEVRSELKRAIGSVEKGSPQPEARRPVELRKKIEAILKPLGLREFIQGEQKLAPEQARAISQALYYSDFGIPTKPHETLVLKATVHEKGDPDAAIAGDDTASCDAFGTGKSIGYALNPGCAQFTLQLVRPDGTARTLAQSLLTKDVDVHKPIDSIVRELGLPPHQETAAERTQRLASARALHEVLPPQAALSKESYLSADNVEVSPNFKREEYQTLASELYRDFFRTYLATYGDDLQINRTTVPIGLGHSDALTHLEKIPNTFAPRTPVGYSDKTHATAYALRPSEPTRWHASEVTVKKPLGESISASLDLGVPGIERLTSQDALAVSYLESKIYADNKSLLTRWGAMENALIAKDINNLIKDRPNLSLKHVDKEGRVTGYVLAYEGVQADTKEVGVYISDMATEQGESLRAKVAGARLVQGFTQAYVNGYLKEGKLLPIFAEAREATSYHLVVNNLKKISQELGVEFTLEEGKRVQRGQDLMHTITIRPRKK